MVALVAAPLGALVLWAVLAWPQGLHDAPGGIAALVIGLIAGAAWRPPAAGPARIQSTLNRKALRPSAQNQEFRPLSDEKPVATFSESGLDSPADRQAERAQPPIIVFAAKAAGVAAARAIPTALRLLSGSDQGGLLRIRRPASRPGQARLAWALNLIPGVQTVSADPGGLFVHIIDETAAPADAIRRLDADGADRAP
jgi:hypothetical protein